MQQNSNSVYGPANKNAIGHEHTLSMDAKLSVLGLVVSRR